MCYICIYIFFLTIIYNIYAFPGGTVTKSLPVKAGDARDAGSIPWSGSPPGEGNGKPLQYSCLRNPMGRGAWWVTKSMGSQRAGHD